jgi:hypothetical protein
MQANHSKEILAINFVIAGLNNKYQFLFKFIPMV